MLVTEGVPLAAHLVCLRAASALADAAVGVVVRLAVLLVCRAGLVGVSLAARWAGWWGLGCPLLAGRWQSAVLSRRVVLAVASVIRSQRGMPSYCENGLACNFAAARLDGSSSLRGRDGVVRSHFFGQSSFASHCLASERNVVKVRADVPLELLGPLGCGIQAGAGAVLNATARRPHGSIAVFGVGSVGLSAVMAAHAAGDTTIIGIDTNPARLELAAELGATHVINATVTDPVAEVWAITGTGADYAIEASGRAEALRQAVDCLGLLGICGLIGGPPAGAEVTLDMNRILFGRTVRGILGGDSIPDLFIPHLIELYLRGRFPFDRLITFYPLREINQAADDSLAGRAVKPVLRP
jgi:aryl-alcohol dehydrogenase